MQIIVEKWYEDFLFSSDKRKLNLDYIHSFLAEESYWATGIPKEIVSRGIENAMCFGIYHQQWQVGFARVITDYATFGYLADVFVDQNYRGKGLSKKLMDFIFSIEELKRFRRMILVTRDAHGLYKSYGFKALAVPDRYMELHRPDIYRKTVIR
jgi:ribosomal protein S18 acetylase RimI-like enzyme